MFESITERLGNVFRTVMGKAQLTEANISEAMEEVRTALLEADVHLEAARSFTDKVKEKALGAKAIPGIEPGQQFVKAVYDGLTEILGGERGQKISWSVSGPTVIMLCGLQGVGKTTTAAKLANKIKKEGRHPMLAAADVQRPAAVEQLKVLGEQCGVFVHSIPGADPVTICRSALSVAKEKKMDVIILDTAGRLHVDAPLMDELEAIVKAVAPREILFVCDAMIGQSAVDTAREFKKRLPLTGAVMTKMDGDARGGAALSLAEASGVPIKIQTTGEKLDSIEDFYPDRMAQRILGMGDVISLAERAQSVMDEKEALNLQKKLQENTFTLEDFRSQLQMIHKMGSFKDILGMIPGVGARMKDMGGLDDKEFVRFESLMDSMTSEERRNPNIIRGTRKVRITKGAGRPMKDVEDLLNMHAKMHKMIGTMGKRGLFSGGGMGALQTLMSGGLSGLASERTSFGSKKAGTKAQKPNKRDKKKRRK